MDLISRQAALDDIDKNRKALLSIGMGGAEHILFHYGRPVIEDLPTIDAVPVVRCKDCKWATNEPYRGDDVWICNFNHWRRAQGKRKPDFFCADGERSEDD